MSNKYSIVFFVFLMISITPAAATQMEEIGHAAEKFNEDSKKEMGFFAKVKFTAKGFILADQAKEAQKAADNGNNNTELDNEKKLQLLWGQHIGNFKNQVTMLKFRESKNPQTTEKQSNKLINDSIVSNNFKDNTDHAVTPGNMSIPVECQSDADKILQMLNGSGINASQNIQHEVTKELQGKIVQIIDEKGNLRYVYVKSMMLNGKNQQITVVTNGSQEKILTLDDFKKSYTGIIINFGSKEAPGKILDLILKNQTDELDQQKADAQKLRDKSRSGLIMNGVLIGVGIALILLGIVLYWVYNTFIKPHFLKTITEEIPQSVEITDPKLYDETVKSFADDKGDSPLIRDMIDLDNGAFGTLVRGAKDVVGGETAGEEYLIGMSGTTLNEAFKSAMYSVLVRSGVRNVNKYLTQAGITYTVFTTTRIVGETTAGLYIRTAIGIISLILVLVGIGMIAYNSYQGYKNLRAWLYLTPILKGNKRSSGDLTAWYKVNNVKKDVSPLNNSEAKNNTTDHQILPAI